MSISFQCPTCGAQLKVSETLAGQVKQCPRCKELIRVPAKTQEQPPPSLQEPPKGAEEELPAAPAAPEPKPEAEPKKDERKPEIASVELLTTTALSKPGYRVTKTLPMVMGRRVVGMKFFKDLYMSIRDTSGGRSQAAENAFTEVESEVLRDIQEQAYEAGANAVVAVAVRHVEISGKSQLLYVAAQGTPVVLTKIS